MNSVPIPPDHLLSKVGNTGNPSEYVRLGVFSAHAVENFLGRQGFDFRALTSWLDLACGCGRTLNFLRRDLPPEYLCGCDYDSNLIEWCRENLPGIRFAVNREKPPLPFADAGFDMVYSISFFTHLDQTAQAEWLGEIGRVLRPGGLILLSLHGKALARRKSVRLRVRGVRHYSAGPAFNQQLTYQTRSYLEREWGRDFDILAYESLALDDHQDFVLLALRGSVPEVGRPVLPEVPLELRQVWERRPDLHPNFDSQGIGRPDSSWRNLSLIDWAILRGHLENPELSRFAPQAYFRVSRKDTKTQRAEEG